MLDIRIDNARIIDGSGSPSYTGSLGMKDGKLVMDPGTAPAEQTVDAGGRVVCPGFIDAHSHGDRLLGTRDGWLFKTPQGVTTELCGQCGSSQTPVNEERAQEMYAFFSYCKPLEVVKRWTRFDAFLEDVQGCRLTANAKFYVGHRTLRMAVMGLDNRPATTGELDNMRAILRESMEAGAAGLSTGLIYEPGCYADTNEVLELAKVLAPFDGIYASHIRNESFAVVDGVKEVLDIGRRAGVRTNISHHKAMGRDNWGKQKQTLELIHRANEEGCHTTIDQYPYPRCMSTLRSCIPNWYLSQGPEELARRLRDHSFRTQLRREMEDPATPYDNFYRSAGGWDGIYIATAGKTPEAEGKFVSEYAQQVGKDPWSAYFDLMVENNCTAGGVYCAMSEADMCDIIQSPYCVVGSDGCTVSWAHKGHPRASATFPRAINYYVKEKRILTLEQMLHKMTGLTAQRLLVPNKGLLKEGYDADVLILNYDNLKDLATYDEPNRLTEGVDQVFVGGQLVYADMEFTGACPGRFVPHP